MPPPIKEFVPGHISWEEAATVSEEYAEVLAREELGHKLFVDGDGTIRWVPNEARKIEIMNHYGALDLNDLFRKGADKNDPKVRELYKCLGYSLSGFWEVFYWETNNRHQIKYQGRMSDEQYTWLLLRYA